MKNVTATSSTNIDVNKVGTKKPTRVKKSVQTSPEKRINAADMSIPQSQMAPKTCSHPSNINNLQLISSKSLQYQCNNQLTQVYPNVFVNTLKDVKDNEVIVTLISMCDKRVSVCNGCSNPLKFNGYQLMAPYDLVLIAKMRREYYNDGQKHYSSPSNCYYHCIVENPFVTPFECIQRRLLTFNSSQLKLHYDAYIQFAEQHKIAFRQLGLFQMWM